MTTADQPQSLIGLFDILGYKELAKRNPISSVVGLIEDKFEKGLRETQEKVFGKGRPSRFNSCIYADTCLVTSSTGEGKEQCRFLLAMLSFGYLFTLDMFRAGVPIRGAIHLGDVYFGRTANGSLVVAGKGLMEANEFAECQKWSGCALSEAANGYCEQVGDSGGWRAKYLLGNTCIPYLAQTKKDAVNTRAIGWPSQYVFDKTNPLESPIDLCEKAFTSWNKPREGAEEKIANTAKFIEESWKSTREAMRRAGSLPQDQIG